MYERVEERLPRSQSVGNIEVLLSWISSWELALLSEGKSDKTIRGYTDAAVRMADWLLNLAPGHPLVGDWREVSRTHFRQYMQWFQNEHTKVYANNQYRALQQFWKWYVTEEEVPDPMVNTKPPKVPERIMPMLKHDDMIALIKDAKKGRDFVSRRDVAILRFHGCTGCRLAEIAGLAVRTVDLKDRVATVIGKGDIERAVPFDQKCALALDRYLRVRARHKYAASKKLWLAARNRPPLTADGIYQMIARRADVVSEYVSIPTCSATHFRTTGWTKAGPKAT